MIRLLCALGALLILLVLGESALREHQRTGRRTAGALRLLTPEPTAAVAQIEIHAGGRRWHYVRHGGSWHFPAYHRAFALNRRVEHLLQSLLATPATFVSAEPGDLARYGLGPGRIRIHLLDQQGRPLLEVRQGRGAPRPRAGESYIQRVGADSIFHLHAHPVHALDTTPPAPMLDRRVLPQALQRKGLRRIAFAGDPAYPVQSLGRQLKAMTSPGPVMPTYEWVASSAAGPEVCLTPSVEAYADFLKHLTWSALHDPGRTEAFAQARYLYLEDEDGTIDTLAVGTADDRGHYLRLHTTGHICSITPAKAALLFPTRAALRDTLPQPSPYHQAER